VDSEVLHTWIFFLILPDAEFNPEAPEIHGKFGRRAAALPVTETGSLKIAEFFKPTTSTWSLETMVNTCCFAQKMESIALRQSNL